MGNFPKFKEKNSKLSILTENWLQWYLRGADSESRLRCLKFWHQISVLGKFWSKKLKSVLSENWHIWCLKKADFYFIIIFLKFRPQNQFLAKFGPKKSKLSVWSKSWRTLYLKDADSYSNISFLNFQRKKYVWPNLGQKSQNYSFWLKIGTHGISRMLIVISTFFSWISNENPYFGQIWGQKVKIVHSSWKFAPMVSRGCGFLFQNKFSEFQDLNPFLDRCSYTTYLEGAYLFHLKSNLLLEKITNEVCKCW